MPADHDRPELEVRREGDVDVVTVQSPAMLDTFGWEKVSDQLYRLIEERNIRRLVLNLGNVRHVSSVALGDLVKLKRKLIEHQGSLRLCGLRPALKRICELMRIDSVVEIHPDPDSAIKSFDSP